MGGGGATLNYGAMASSVGNSADSKAQDRASRRRVERTYAEGGPERFKQYFEQYLPIHQQIQEPMRAQGADMAAMRGQNRSNEFGNLVARRGLAGSGADIFGRMAQEGQTSAEMNENLRSYYINALQGASGQSERAQDRRTGVLANMPVTSFSNFGALSKAAGALLGG